MKERPILFSAPMARALRDGRKTQTRRVMKSQWTCDTPGFRPDDYTIDMALRHCPYGKAGDRLWVRETWACLDSKVRQDSRLAYRADTEDGERVRVDAPWRPSIFMPRWASRITLMITEVRVQRLQEISEEDAIAEGCVPWKGVPGDGEMSAVQAYCQLWNSINGAGSWDANPWVWAVTFKVIQ